MGNVSIDKKKTTEKLPHEVTMADQLAWENKDFKRVSSSTSDI